MKLPNIFSRNKNATVIPIVQVCFTSIISKDITSLGEIHLTGNLRIDGRHEGKIKKSAEAKKPVTVYIGPSGYVHGVIDVDVIIIDGHVNGTCKANINLYSQGTVKGHAFYGEDMDISGNFNAKLQKLTDRQKQICQQSQPNTTSLSNVIPLKVL